MSPLVFIFAVFVGGGGGVLPNFAFLLGKRCFTGFCCMDGDVVVVVVAVSPLSVVAGVGESEGELGESLFSAILLFFLFFTISTFIFAGLDDFALEIVVPCVWWNAGRVPVYFYKLGGGVVGGFGCGKMNVNSLLHVIFLVT